jgi:hypothetical protein
MQSASSSGAPSESKTFIANPVHAVYRVVPPARTMNIHRPSSQAAVKKHIASRLYYTFAEETV